MYFNKYILVIVFLKCTTADGDSTVIKFFIEDNQNKLKCKRVPAEGQIQDKGSFRIIATAQETLRTSKCVLQKYNSVSNLTTLHVKQTESLGNVLESEELHFSAEDMNDKSLVCRVTLERPFQNRLQCDDHPCVACILHLNFTSNVAEGRALKDEGADKENIIIVGSVVGVIVLLIVVGQTIALLYFRERARAQERTESLRRNHKPRSRNENVRYSAPPTRNTKTTREEDRDSHNIYEAVVVDAVDTGSSTNSILDIRDRPPLPLPEGRSPKIPPCASTNSVSLDSSGHAPMRPVKEPPVKPKLSKPPSKVDETNLPGSLTRPTKPVPKTGSTTMASDPSLTELKNVLKMRNIEASASSSPVSTLERKPQTFTPKKIPPPHETAKSRRNPPVSVVKPLPSPDHVKPSINPLVAKTNPTSTMKPKLDTLNLKKPNVIETPIQHPTKSPFSIAPSRHIHAIHANSSMSPVLKVSPKSPTVPMTSLSSWSPMYPALPNSTGSPKSTGSLLSAVQVKAKGACRPLPPEPIESEDANQDDDDDEWTYEALDSYNIYNV